jgi:outer membrane lipoprotein carrier protein
MQLAFCNIRFTQPNADMPKPTCNDLMHRILYWGSVVLAGSVLLLGQTNARAQTPAALLQQLKERYAAIETFRADFTYTVGAETNGPEASRSGTLTMQGTRYRVETSTQTVVTDGTVTWIYNAADDQVIVNDYAEDEVLGLLNDFLFSDTDLLEITDAETVMLDGEQHHRLTLKPASANTAFREVTLWMRARDRLVTRLTFTDVNDVQIRFSLQDIVLNPALDARTFTFTPPATAEVIDLRS